MIMATSTGYPFVHHPCYSENRQSLWHRIHLPVASRCNVKCAFCSHSLSSSCHTSMPGTSSMILTPEAAAARTMSEIKRNPLLRIVAISGPGEPLANKETFETLERIRRNHEELAFCMSTNGILLEEYVDWLVAMRVETISISMSTLNRRTASKIYEWAKFRGGLMKGRKMGSRIVESQLLGIARASRAGIIVKVNSILIPELNMYDIKPLAKELSKAGATLQNIVPLIPNDKFSSCRPPTREEVRKARSEASVFIKQFSHCKQCRSDVVGIPGCDEVL
ncbi:MAG: radical SAM protein [Candidatus Thorarchaeota archaeon]|nr:radical SAM protein [Candidatus Thorarchaeota archaeon]